MSWLELLPFGLALILLACALCALLELSHWRLAQPEQQRLVLALRQDNGQVWGVGRTLAQAIAAPGVGPAPALAFVELNFQRHEDLVVFLHADGPYLRTGCWPGMEVLWPLS